MRKVIIAAAFLAGLVFTQVVKIGLDQVSTPYRLLAIEPIPNGFPHTSYAADWIANPVIQSKPALCGAASIEAVLRSYGEARDQEVLLKASSTLNYWTVNFVGMTIDEMAGLMEEQGGYETEVHRPGSLDELRSVLATLEDESARLIANYSRMPLTGENIGHHTPIAGFDKRTDSVALHDVTDGYGSYVLPVAALLTAILTPDSETGLQRGILIVRRSA